MMRWLWGVFLLLASGAMHFVERASEAGMDASIQCGGPEKRWIFEANGTGVAALDYDNDGWLDVLIVNGSSLDRLTSIIAGNAPAPPKTGVYLYRNLGNGRFEDVTVKAGLSNPYWGTGANAADYNNDGFTDILITTIGRDLLYRNNGDGTFTDVSESAGLSRAVAWHTGSAFGDYDGDSHPDLYVAGYVNIQSLPIAGPPPVCRYLNLPVFCGPMNLKGERDILYHNNGNGAFTDVTEKAGVFEREPRYGFTVVFEDFDQDGRPDIFVANDSGPNYLYRNTGRGTFEEVGLISGVAYNADGKSQANMGVAIGDYDNDGDLDILTTTFSEDYFPLFEQKQPGVYEDVSARAGLGTVTIPWLGWACGFTDFDNDGYRDLWIANGHVYPAIGQARRSPYEQPIAILQNRAGKFTWMPDVFANATKNSWRGGVAADFNNNGKMDLLVVPISGAPLLLENHSTANNNWIGLDLRGRNLGVQVTITACGKKWFDTVRNGGSYLSNNDPRLHFGLGACSQIDRVTISWPRGTRQVLSHVAVNRYHVIREQ